MSEKIKKFEFTFGFALDEGTAKSFKQTVKAFHPEHGEDCPSEADNDRLAAQLMLCMGLDDWEIYDFVSNLVAHFEAEHGEIKC